LTRLYSTSTCFVTQEEVQEEVQEEEEEEEEKEEEEELWNNNNLRLAVVNEQAWIFFN